MSGSHLSKDFFEFVKSIGESKSKQEEERIVIQEISSLKRRMNETTTTGGSNANTNVKKKQKEFLIRIIYVEMLGYDASFGYIKAIELTASSNLMHKRIGYLTCSLVLSPSHEFRFMIINQLQRDLQSSNYLEVNAALVTIAKLITTEMIPAILPMIIDLLKHENELIRKKSIMVLHRFYQLNHETLLSFNDKLRYMLCDKDPSVMGTTLCILYEISHVTPTEYSDLVPSYVSILKQITEHRLPREYDYHRIPAPWIQLRLLKILSALGKANQQTSEQMYEVLYDVMRRADTGINVGYAIIYECISTITNIYPNVTLLDAAAASITRFITSDNHNLKYLGITSLASIVKDYPKYAIAHQMAVIDCLEDSDETLKRKTLDLLYHMTNPANIEYITEKLIQFLRETNDIYLRKELVQRITQCAERYAPSNEWYIDIITTVFDLGGELVNEEVAHNLLHLIADGDEESEDEEQDEELKKYAVETYLGLIEKPVLPDILVHVMCWILGEYCYLTNKLSLEDISRHICELMTRPFIHQDTTRGYIITALLKVCAFMKGNVPKQVRDIIERYSRSRSTDLQQRCYEFLGLLQSPDFMIQVLPKDACNEEVEIDPNLDFLHNFIQNKGGREYSPPPAFDSDDEEESRHRKNKGKLNFEAYEKPELPRGMPAIGTTEPTGRWGQPNVYPQQPNQQPPMQGMPPMQGQGFPPQQQQQTSGNAWPATQQDPAKKAVRNVWGPTGCNLPDRGPTGPAPSVPQQPPNTYPPQPLPSFRAQGSVSGNEYANPAPPEDTAQVDERQMLASALFQGLPGASSQVLAHKPSYSRNKQRPSKTAIDGKKEDTYGGGAQASVDLLDMGYGGNTQQQNSAYNMSGMQNALPSTDPSMARRFSYNGLGCTMCRMTTQDFGGLWGNMKIENKIRLISASTNTLEVCMQRFNQYQIFPVEAIPQANELIAATQVGQMVCLIHSKLHGQGVMDITIRSGDKYLTDQLLAFLNEVLK